MSTTHSNAEALRAAFQAAEGDTSGLSAAQRRTRQRIVRAATDNFVRFGYRRASMDDVAREAGVGKGTLYLYFKSKRDLLITCVVREKRRMLPELEAVFALPAEQQLRAYLRATLHFALTAPLSSSLLRGDHEISAVMDEMGADQVEANREQGLALLAPMLEPLMGGASPDSRRKVALLVSAMPAMLAHVEDERIFGGLRADTIADLLGTLLAAGVRSGELS